MISIQTVGNAVESELVHDLRRTVLCGELNWDREVVRDGRDPGHCLLLAYDGAKPVGTARLLRTGQGYQVDAVAVLPRWRGQGLGRRLLADLLGRVVSSGGGMVTVVSPAPTGDFFKALGFELDAQQDGYQALKIVL